MDKMTPDAIQQRALKTWYPEGHNLHLHPRFKTRDSQTLFVSHQYAVFAGSQDTWRLNEGDR